MKTKWILINSKSKKGSHHMTFTNVDGDTTLTIFRSGFPNEYNVILEDAYGTLMVERHTLEITNSRYGVVLTEDMFE